MLNSIRNAALMVLAAASPLLAQDTLQIDLAGKSQDTVRVNPGRYAIELLNTIPHQRYIIAVHQQAVAVSPLSPPSLSATANMLGPPKCLEAEDSALGSATRALEDAAAEAQVPSLMRSLQAVIERAGPCTSDSLQAASLEISKTSLVRTGSVKLSAGHYLVVIVTRSPLGNGDSKPSPTWTRVFTTGRFKDWRLTYGFAFPYAFGGRGVFGGGRQYYARPAGTQYIITEKKQTNYVDAVPIIMYSFMPVAAGEWSWDELDAALGLDLTQPMVTLGTGLSYGSNLLLSIGVAAREVRVLDGQFAPPNDTVKDNLTWEQMSVNAIRFRPYVGVTFRFGSNPFAKLTKQPTPAETSNTGSTPQK